MEISSRGRYAVMAVCDLSQAASDRPVSLAEIAERLGISVSYLEQLFAQLRRSGLVRSVRGPGGGYFLSKRATEISVADVFDAVAPAARGRAADAPVDTAPLWSALGNVTRSFLSRVSIQQVSAGDLPRADVIVVPRDREPRMAAD